MRSVKSLMINISPSKLTVYGAILMSCAINVWLFFIGLAPIVIAILSLCLWCGLGGHLWLSFKQTNIETIEVGTERVLSVNGERAHDWHICTESRQLFGMIWLVVATKSKNKSYKQLLMSDSFKFEFQYRQLKTILRYIHLEQKKEPH